MPEDSDAVIKDALLGASADLERNFASRVPDLSQAHRRRLRRRSSQARLMLGLGCLALVVGVAATALAGRGSDQKVQVSSQKPNPEQLTLPDGQKVLIDLPAAFLDGQSPRVILGTRVQLHGDCCPNSFATFSDTATGAKGFDGPVVDSWTNAKGMQLQVLQGPGSLNFIQALIGRFRMEIRMPALTPSQIRDAVNDFSVTLATGDYPVVAASSLDESHGASGSALLDYGANKPTLSLLASACTSTGIVHPVEADTPEAQRCYPEAGYEVTLQASFGQSTIGHLGDLSKSVDVHKVQ